MLSARGVRLALDGQAVLRGVDLEVGQGEILCLLGPSGCGKTTLLRAITGLERPDAGDVLVEGRSVLGTPVHARDFGLMFQDYALFPHMSVAENVAFGLKMRRLPDAARRVREALALVGLAGLERRAVTQLSGGERQRVALARSLAPGPRLLMLDEPLGALDAALRDRLVVELRAIIRQVGLTAIYVTHDQREAFAVADRIAIMNAGQIEQVDVPEAIYRRPATEFVARFLGLNNIVPVLGAADGRVSTPVGEFVARPDAHSLLLHPVGLRLAPVEAAQGSITGVAQECVFQGDTYRLTIAHESGLLFTFAVPVGSRPLPHVGQVVTAAVDPQTVVALGTSARETAEAAL